MNKNLTETKRIFFFIVMGITLPFNILAQTMSSPSYKIENPQFNSGGENSSSTNFRSRDSIGGEDSARSTSTNFRLFPGFLPPAYPGVPGVPTLANTGGTLYNSLDFAVSTGGNPSDVNYAVAISSDAFVSDINYIQTNLTIATSTVWQLYSAWGSGALQRVTTLLPNTTYTIKVKARYGPDSETGFSNTVQAATVAPTLTATIQGVASGTTIGGVSTTIDTTATSVAFSTLQNGSIKLGAQKITVNTNAVAGYTVTLQQNQDLTKNNGAQIPGVSASNTTPAAWPSGVTTGRFGYHTTDTSLCTGTAGRFTADDTYAAATSTPFEVTCNNGPVSNEVTNIVFKVEIEALQPSGNYQNNITYITTAQY
jgi:hypothetical protein